MLAALRKKLTYANVTATLALVIAVGGGSAYAINEWNGSNIQNETLTGADVRGSKAAGTPGSLKGEDILDASLGNVDVAASALTGSRLRDESVTGIDINESTLAKVPDADRLDGVDITGVARVASQEITLSANSSTGIQGKNLEIPGFGSLFSFCPPDPMGTQGQVAYTAGGSSQEVWIDDGGSTPAQVTLGHDQGSNTQVTTPNDMVTFIVSRTDGAVLRIVFARVVWESVISPGTYRCTHTAQATWKTP